MASPPKETTESDSGTHNVTSSSTSEWQHGVVSSKSSSSGFSFRRRIELSSSSNYSSSSGPSFISRAPLLSTRSASSGCGSGSTSEPIGILGKGRRYSGGPSVTFGTRHSVKFNEPEDADKSGGPPESPRRFLEGGFKFRHSPELRSQSSIPESPDDDGVKGGSKFPLKKDVSKETSAAFAVETSSMTMTTKSKSHFITRTADKNSLIASMELKVPSILTPSFNEGGANSGGVTPSSLALPECRGLTILSPHNPCPELHFASAFTLRTRKGKTIMLPKLRLPGIQAHSHDSIFLGWLHQYAVRCEFYLSRKPSQDWLSRNH